MGDRPSTKKRKSKKLVKTLTVAFLLLTSFVFLVGTGFETYFNLLAQRDDIINQQKLIADTAANRVRGFVTEMSGSLRTAAYVGGANNHTPETRKIFLEKLLGLQDAFRSVMVLDVDGREIGKIVRLQAGVREEQGHVDIEELSEKIRNGEEYVSPVYLDDASGEPLMLLAVPITDVFRDLKGSLVAEVNLKFMWDLVDRIQVGQGGFAYVVSSEGRLLAFRDTSRILKEENVAALQKVNEFIVKGIDENREEKFSVTGILGTPVVSAFIALGTPDWAVMTELPAGEAYRPVIQRLVITFLITFAALLLAFATSIYLSRKITQPIVDLRNAAEEVRRGNLSMRIAVASRDEIGELALVFNDMTAQLQSVYENLEKKVAERTEELKSQMEQSERVSKLMIDREVKMVELKKEIADLKRNTPR